MGGDVVLRHTASSFVHKSEQVLACGLALVRTGLGAAWEIINGCPLSAEADI
jgi:hypothetical protein